MTTNNIEVDTLVVGAGQAGVAMSEHLSSLEVSHLVLERSRIAERWRSWRWDSLVANGPAWHDRFPGLGFDDFCRDAFVPKTRVADYFEAYAKIINAPIRTGVEVTRVVPNSGRPGFRINTSDGVIEATRVVAATGPFQQPAIPPLVPDSAGVKQIHSSAYRNPRQLSEGAVLVVGAGSSGVQIADELQRAGRKVFLAVGEHDRPPRSYRGRDYDWWLGVLGLWDVETKPGLEHVTIAVSGAHGGETVDFRRLAHRGMILVGRMNAYSSGVVKFESDLAANIKRGDDNYLSLLDAADEYVACNGIDLPQEAQARDFLPDPECVTRPLRELDLVEAGISTIIWATGFTRNFDWLEVDAFDEQGNPRHQRGVSSESGIYFLGLPWLSNRGSSFIWGVWHDAKYIADHIGKQRKYQSYHEQAQRRTANG